MTEVDELIRSAHNALLEGNRLIARGYLRRASRLAPDRLDVWRELLEISEQEAERQRALERIVELDPSDTIARSELEDLKRQPPAPDPLPIVSQGPEQAPSAAPAASGLSGMRLDVTDEMRRQWERKAAAGEPLYCIDHPARQTVLRCNRCTAPICTSCAVRTPVGLRCRKCVQAQQAVFFTARWYDYPIAALVSLALSVPAAILTSMLGFWFAIILSPVVGGVIGAVVHWSIGRRRGRWIWLVVGACIVTGALVAVFTRSFDLISIGIFTALAVSAAVGVLRLGRR